MTTSPLSTQATGCGPILDELPAEFGRGEEWKYSDIRAAIEGLTELELKKSAGLWQVLHAPFGGTQTLTSSPAYDSPLIIDQNGERLKITLPARQSAHVQLAFSALPRAYIPSHVVIEVGEGASLTIFEHQGGKPIAAEDGPGAGYWKNIRMEINLAARGQLTLNRQMSEDAGSVSFHDTIVRIQQSAEFYFTLTNLGHGFLRHQMRVDLLEPHSIADLAGINLLDRKSHGDVTLKINHMAPQCRSSQYFKTILRDQAHGVYQGKIHVHQNAQKTDGYQLSNNLLLSPLAEMDVKPELEIYADDVKCSHGTTTGELDETPIFYMKSRGIDEDSARKLLLSAFIEDILLKISNEALRAHILDQTAQWLHKA